MGAEPVGRIGWVYDGEKFVDGVYEVTCAGCHHVVFSADVCPRCHAPGGLKRALATPNLFNLVPLSPLDGGRVAGVISPRLWLLGVPLLGAIFLWRPSPLLLLIAMAAAPQVWAALKGTAPAHAMLSRPSDKIRFALQYIGLAAALAVMAYDAHQWLSPG